MFCVICQAAVDAKDVPDALECLTCTQGLHEACYNEYSEHAEDDETDDLPCPSCRCTVTMQAVKHREWASTLNVIHVIRRRADADMLTDATALTQILAAIITSTPIAAVVTTYACKCLYSMSVGKATALVTGSSTARGIAAAVTLYPDDEELSLWACAALYALSRDAKNCVNEVLTVVAAAAQRHQAIVIIPYYAAMVFRMVHERYVALAPLVLTNTCMPVCLSALQLHGSPLLTKAVTGFLCSMSTNTVCCEVMAGDVDGLGSLPSCVPALTTALSKHVDDDEIMLNALITLRNICEIRRNFAVVTAQGVVRSVFETIRRVHSTVVVSRACEVLQELASHVHDKADGAASEFACEVTLLSGPSRLHDVTTRAPSDGDALTCVTRTLVALSNAGVDVSSDGDTGRLACRAITTAHTHYPKYAYKLFLAVQDHVPYDTAVMSKLLSAALRHVKEYARPAVRFDICHVVRHVVTKGALQPCVDMDTAVRIAAVCMADQPVTASGLLREAITTANASGASGALRCVMQSRKIVDLLACGLPRGIIAATVAWNKRHASVAEGVAYTLDALILVCDAGTGLLHVAMHAKNIVGILSAYSAGNGATCSDDDDNDVKTSHHVNSSDGKVVTASCRLLGLLATSEARRVCLGVAGAVPALIDVLRFRHRYEGKGVTQAVLAARALGSLCTTSNTRQAAGALGALPVLIDAMLATGLSSDKSIVQHCMRAVGHIMTTDAANAKEVQKCYGAQVISDIAEACSSCARTLSYACFVLVALTNSVPDACASVLSTSILRTAFATRDTSILRRAASVTENISKQAAMHPLFLTLGYVNVLHDVLRRGDDDATLSLYITSALEHVFETQAASIGPDTASDLFFVLGRVLQKHVHDVDIVRNAACAMVSLGDVHSREFLTTRAGACIHEAFDGHNDDGTLFDCSRKAAGIHAGVEFMDAVLASVH